MNIIARIHSDFPTKFGIPRQSGLIDDLRATIVFEPEYRNIDALRGLEGFSHIWLIWQFSAVGDRPWTPTVRPPRLGGNKRMGVFATRSPFRPNPIGLSSVRLDKISIDPEFGPVIHVLGADLMDGTPIYDIKPYLPQIDAHPEAEYGYVQELKERELTVELDEPWFSMLPEDIRTSLCHVLEQDPRPSYQQDPDRIYGFEYAGYEVRFKVRDKVLSVCEVRKL